VSGLADLTASLLDYYRSMNYLKHLFDSEWRKSHYTLLGFERQDFPSSAIEDGNQKP
jgi:hypothetical protein